MTNGKALLIAALMGFLAVVLGAFGAHSLQRVLQKNGASGVWGTAVLYHLIHTLMLFVLAGRLPLRAGPWWSFFIGIVLFSGSLYLLALTNLKWLGAITPLGGISFLIGWLWLVLHPPAPT